MTSSLNYDHACPVVDVLPIWLGVKKDVSLCKMPVSGRRALDGVCPHIAKVIKPWCADGLFWGNRNNCITICHHFSTLRWHRDLEVSLTEKVPSLLWRHNGEMASQITSLTIVYSNVHSGADQRKHQSSASLAFVRGIHRWPVNSPHKGPVNAENVSIWWRHHDLFDIIRTMTSDVLATQEVVLTKFSQNSPASAPKG